MTLTKRHRSAVMRSARQPHYIIENGLVAVVGRLCMFVPFRTLLRRSVRSTHARYGYRDGPCTRTTLRDVRRP